MFITNNDNIMEDKKNYYAIIPSKVRYCKGLSANAKLLYGEITALSNEKGFCWAGNKYFADLYEITERSVSRLISSLSENGFIQVVLDSKRIRKVYLNDVANVLPPRQKCPTPLDKNVLHNNTYNNTIEKDRKTPIESPKVKESTEVEIKPNKEEKEKNISAILKKEKEVKFEAFRKRYPGTKNGSQTELKNFTRHKDWMEVADVIEDKLEYEGRYREWMKAKEKWVPDWKNLQTWINNRCWEQEFPDYDIFKKLKIKSSLHPSQVVFKGHKQTGYR